MQRVRYGTNCHHQTPAMIIMSWSSTKLFKKPFKTFQNSDSISHISTYIYCIDCRLVQNVIFKIMFQDFPCFSFSIRWLQSNCPSSCDPGRRKAIDQSHGRWPGDLLHECSEVGGVCLEEGTKQLGKPMEKQENSIKSLSKMERAMNGFKCVEMFRDVSSPKKRGHGNLTGLWSCCPPFRGCAV